VAEPLHVKIGEDAHQRWSHVDPAALAQVGEVVETEKIVGLHDRLLEQGLGTARALHAVHCLRRPIGLSSI
jgi:hypothetical protein